MVQRVLILEKNQETADRLATALRRTGDVNVSLVPTMREACLIVAQNSQDLAFIPLEDAESLHRSLRALQPNLKMVLMTADTKKRLPDEYRDTFESLLHTEFLETELPTLLGSSPAKTDLTRFNQVLEAVSPPSLTRLKEACEELGLTKISSPVQLAVLCYAGKVIGYCGDGPESQALAVADLISRNWQRGQYTAQLQYLQLPEYYDARLVYSRTVAGVVLSLVAEPEIPIGDMRKLANRLARRLSDTKEEPAESPRSRFTAISRSNGNPNAVLAPTYAIAWRPVKALPVVLENIVRNCVSVIAAENSCRLRHLSVTPTIAHLVIGCPAGKTAAWVVFLMKSGINKEIQRQFGTQPSIWQKGFYATESEQPLSDAELNMLLTP